jgi:phosphate transport system permease protein
VAEHSISDRLSRKRTRHLRERFIEFLLLAAGGFSIAVTLGIVYVLVSESFHFFQHISLWDFLTDTQWTPLFDDAHYGIMVLLSGTIVSSGVALAVAVPLGIISRSTCRSSRRSRCVRWRSPFSSCWAESRPWCTAISLCCS